MVPVDVRHYRRSGDARKAKAELDVDGAPDAWRLTMDGRAYEPARFERRGESAWVVFRPIDLARAGDHVQVGCLTVLATDSVALLRCGAPVDLGVGASVEWGDEAPDLFPLCAGGEPDPPIGASSDPEPTPVPLDRARRSAAAPVARGDDTDEYVDTSDDDYSSDEPAEPDDDTFENPLDVEDDEEDEAADSDEEFALQEDDDPEDPGLAAESSDDDDDA